MKKKIIMPIIISLILVIGVIGFIILKNNVSTITLDINPSIEIKLTKNEKIKSIIALNNDAKEIIDNNLVGKTLDEALKNITAKVIENDYTKENRVTVLIYTKGSISNKDIERKISNSFSEKDIYAETILIENITKEDNALAKKYNITPAKASYIKIVSKENENLNVDELINKPIQELKETKDTGNYCPEGYTLEGSQCLKEKERVNASNGKVCPEGYYEYKEKCYHEVPSEESDKLFCHEDFKLNGTTCTRTETINAEPSKYNCNKGEAKTRVEMGLTNPESGDANDIVCVDLSNATHPVTPCELPANDPTERMSSGGKCYWHRAPVLPEGCPGKIQVAGECWDDASNIYICAGYRDGKQYKSKNEYCEHSIKYIDSVVSEYKCPEGYKLNGNKCEKTETEDAIHERICPNNYTIVDNDRCIDYNKTANKQNGYVCNKENTRLRGNQCITYEIIEAKHK